MTGMTPYASQAEALAHLDDEIVGVNHFNCFCPMSKTLQGELAPCDKETTTVVTYEFDGSWFVDLVCTYHAHMLGMDHHVPMLDVIDAARRTR